MKKTILLLTIGFITMLLASMCDKPCYDPDYRTEITDLSASLFDGEKTISENSSVSYNELQLKIRLDLSVAEYVYHTCLSNGVFPMLYAKNLCLPENKGLCDKISSVTLTCDKPIGNLAAGGNLLSDVNFKTFMREYSIDINEWIDLLNDGHDKEYLLFLSEGEYEFNMTTLAAETDIEEGDYVFTARLDYVSGENPFVVTFPPVRLK